MTVKSDKEALDAVEAALPKGTRTSTIPGLP